MKAQKQSLPNLALRRERERRHWTQSELALKIGATYLSVCRWENGTTSPSLYYRRQLCKVFGLPPEALGLASEADTSRRAESEGQAASPTVPAVWQVPFRRNPFFTGREEVLERLAVLLGAGKAAALSQPQALSGLGGIGKTQTAVEYAYRHRQDYQAVFWARAETPETLQADLVQAADLLALPERQQQDQSRVVAAVKRWMSTHDKWLLILDNVEDMALVEDIVPRVVQGHLLLTTRAQSTGGIARSLQLEEMTPEEGALLLLRRVGLLAPDAPLEASAHALVAQDISRMLGGLPLALDQARAYIEETGCLPADYLERCQRHQAALLQRRGRTREHPESVSATFALAFENIQRASPAAADLLRLCAFLAPDAIPEELITAGAVELGETLAPVAADPLALDEVYAVLRRYSLVQRHAENKTLTIHRLVQTVIKDGMGEAMQRQWAERAVRAVSKAFPEGTFEHWLPSERLMSHAQVCAALIKRYHFFFAEAAALLQKAGDYQQRRGQYPQAERLLQQALALAEQIPGMDDLALADILHILAIIQWNQGRYAQAEPLTRRALAIRERVLGTDHPQVADCYNHLGIIVLRQGRPAEAEAMYRRALAIYEHALGTGHLLYANPLANLGLLYHDQGRYAEAEPLFRQALAISENHLGRQHPYVALEFQHLGECYCLQGRYAEAEPLFQRALEIYEQALEADHPWKAYPLNGLADVYLAQGRCAEAEPLFQQALAIREQRLGPDHRLVADSLHGLAMCCLKRERYEEAESFLQRALAIRERTLGPNHWRTALTLDGLAQLAECRQQYAEALSLYRRALAICEERPGPEHPGTVAIRERYSRLQAQTERGDALNHLHQ